MKSIPVDHHKLTRALLAVVLQVALSALLVAVFSFVVGDNGWGDLIAVVAGLAYGTVAGFAISFYLALRTRGITRRRAIVASTGVAGVYWVMCLSMLRIGNGLAAVAVFVGAAVGVYLAAARSGDGHPNPPAYPPSSP